MSESNWTYWNELKSLRLYEAIWLAVGSLPSKRPLTPEEEATDDFEIETIAQTDDHFLLFLSSLRADSECGAEWRNYSDLKALRRIITKSLFFKHWKACNLPISEKFISEKRGAPIKANTSQLIELAKKMKEKGKPYDQLIIEAKRMYGCEEKPSETNCQKKNMRSSRNKDSLREK